MTTPLPGWAAYVILVVAGAAMMVLARAGRRFKAR